MCGICGYFTRNGDGDESLIRRMTETLHHRGPNYTGAAIKGHAALGHARLSIIDLSPSGNQPMTNEDGSLLLICNGEIYNFQEIRRDLEGKGHVFHSNSDSETILHLYEEYGPACVTRLSGMFAFALYDSKKDTFFLARDRIGKKPLFYAVLPDGTFAFGSEVKAIQAHPAFRAEPDMLAIHYYLTYQSVPAPFSAFKGVRKVEPAHTLLYARDEIRTERYWSYDYANQMEVRTEQDEIALQEELITRLRESIRKRMVSDVPIGAFLSGGLDSSLVTALMAELSDRPIRTFSIGFEEKDHDETAYAKIVAERYGTDHTVFEVKPRLLEIIDKLVYHYNEPFADSSAIPTFYLSKLAAEQVTVVLTGDAGDENFAGYSRYVDACNAQSGWRQTLRLLASFFRHDPAFDDFDNPYGTRLENLRRRLLLTPRKKDYYTRFTHFHEYYQNRLYTPRMHEAVGTHSAVDLLLERYERFSGTFLDRTLGVDMTLYLPDTLMVKTDIASMAHALETRCPLLDYEFVEFAARVPSRLKLKDNRISKYIMKKAAEKYLPHDVIYRPKMGFGVPFNHWLRNDPAIRNFTHDTLLAKDSFVSQWLNMDYIREFLERHQKHLNENWQYLIWNLLFLELWHKRFIAQK